jgi:Raf kinase inhibitor-like YbhB/YbcL family protein
VLTISSPEFAPNGSIPATYTSDGDNVSPSLKWSAVPVAAKSLALIVDDPDAPDPRAPQTTWVHWVLYNLPVGTAALPADATSQGLPAGTREGLNDWKRSGYGGPSPPVGRHRYFFKLYALDTVLPDLGSPTKARLLSAMKGHVLAEAQLVGTYERGH